MWNKSIFSSMFILAASLAASVTLAADPAAIVISTGKSGGGYYTIGEKIKGILAEQKQSVDVLTSAGSLENLRHLDEQNSRVNVGITQADALKYYLKKNPAFEKKFMVLGEIGQECVFIITGKDTGIKKDSHLKKKSKEGRQIAVQSKESGVAVTWEYIGILEPKFKNTTAAYVDGAEALLQIKRMGEKSPIKAVMIVQKPMAKSTEMQVVLDHPKDFRFVELKDWDLNDKLPDGTAVYTFEDVTVAEKDWGFDTKVDTICTRGLIVANKEKLSDKQRTQLAKVMLLNMDKIVGDKK